MSRMRNYTPRESLRRFATHPFVELREHRIRERAYYRWLHRSPFAIADALEDWLLAEDEEIREIANLFVRPQYPDGSELNNLSFHLLYDRIALHRFPIGMGRAAIGSSSPRRCALCLRGPPEVSFRNEAHVVPEAFGDRNLLTLNECDGCNAGFGAGPENELAKWQQVDRSIGNVVAKGRAISKHKLRPGLTHPASLEHDGKVLKVKLSSEDDSIVAAHPDPTTLTMSFMTPAFKPVSATKALAKAIFLALPVNRRHDYEHVRRWLMSEDEAAISKVTEIFMPGQPFACPGIVVWETVDGAPKELPSLIGMLWFGNKMLVWGAPDQRLAPSETFLPDLLAPDPTRFRPKPTTFAFESDEPLRMKLSLDLRHSVGVLHSVDGAMEVSFRAVTATGELKIAATLTTPKRADGRIEYDLRGGEMAGVVQLVLEPGAGSGTFVYRPPDGDCDPAAIARSFEFAKLVGEGGEFRIVDARLEEAEPRYQILHWPRGPQVTDTRSFVGPLRFATDLVRINEALGRSLAYPGQATDEDAWSARILSVGLTKGVVRYRVPNGQFEIGVLREQFVELLPMFGKVDHIEGGFDELHFRLCGETVKADLVAVRLNQPTLDLPASDIEDLLRSWPVESTRYVTIVVESIIAQFAQTPSMAARERSACE